MDQALEKAYKKPAKDSIRVTNMSLQKEASRWWYTVRHEKVKFKNFLQEWPCLNKHAEFVLCHYYTTSTDDEMFLMQS